MDRNDKLLAVFLASAVAGVALIVLFSRVAVSAAVADAPEIFGYSEYLTALAVLVVAFTISDALYHFRIAIAPLPLIATSFWTAIAVGIFTLGSQLWFAEGWPLPASWNHPAVWQVVLGAVILLLAVMWVFYSSIRPPKYSRRNAERFAGGLYRLVIRGTQADLSVVATEVARNANEIVRAAPILPYAANAEEWRNSKMSPEAYHARVILLLLANKRLCRYVAADAPGTAIAIFRAMKTNEKYRIDGAQFARNLAAAAFENIDSILYHEDHAYETGLLGYWQPLSSALFGNFTLMEAVTRLGPSPFNLMDSQASWTERQYSTLSRCLLLTIDAYLKDEKNLAQWPMSVARGTASIERAWSDLRQLADVEWTYNNDIYRRLKVGVNFIVEGVDALEISKHAPVSGMFPSAAKQHDLFDELARLSMDLLKAASAIRGNNWRTWEIHYSGVWAELFRNGRSSRAWRIFQFRLRRLIYDHIKELESPPHYGAANVLGLCLNVLGLDPFQHRTVDGPDWPLRQLLLKWTCLNFMKLHAFDPALAGGVLGGLISLDQKGMRLVRQRGFALGSRLPANEYLYLLP